MALSLGLIGRKSESVAPGDTEPAAVAERVPAEPSPAAEAKPVAPAPAVQVDANVPAYVAAPPKDAKRSDSGLAWKRLKKGKGKGRPGKFDTLTVSHTGWTPDGRVFDSSESFGGPLKVPANHLIRGFSEGVRMMAPGEQRRLWIPAALAVSERRMIWIPEELAYQGAAHRPPSMLTVDVKLISIRRDMHQIQ